MKVQTDCLISEIITIMIEYLDNALNPTSGFLTLCTLKGMIPFQKQYKKTLFLCMLILC